MTTDSLPKSKSHDLELTLAWLLRAGSVLAGVLMGAGILATLAGLAAPLASGLVTAGILVLIFTPVMRVAVALLLFLREREHLYALFCVIVLTALLAGVITGQSAG